MLEIPTTKQITEGVEYIPDIQRYFGAFGDAWDFSTGQVLKLETRQTYREPGNPSYDALLIGDFSLALKLLPAARAEDIGLYADLAKRNVDFIRCRPIVRPITEYLRWELECYRFNSEHGEKIYFLDRISIFDTLALHDFMVFDRKVAAIHDYDDDGLLRGGWLIREQTKIDGLIAMFSLIKASSISWLSYKLD